MDLSWSPRKLCSRVSAHTSAGEWPLKKIEEGEGGFEGSEPVERREGRPERGRDHIDIDTTSLTQDTTASSLSYQEL